MKRDITLPGTVSPVPADDVWYCFTDEGQPLYQPLQETFRSLGESSSILVNTFEELEAETLQALSTAFGAAGTKVQSALFIRTSLGLPAIYRSSYKERGR